MIAMTVAPALGQGPELTAPQEQVAARGRQAFDKTQREREEWTKSRG